MATATEPVTSREVLTGFAPLSVTVPETRLVFKSNTRLGTAPFTTSALFAVNGVSGRSEDSPTTVTAYVPG